MIRVRRMVPVLCLLLASPAFAQLEVGEDLMDSCALIEPLRKRGEFGAARDAARRCLEALEDELEGQVGKFFLEQIGDWRRVRFEQNSALGVRNATGEYEKEGKRVRVSLTGGSGAGGLGSALGGLARMGVMGAGRQVRVGGLPATVTPEGQVLVTLEDGSLLSFDCAQLNTAEEALSGMGDLINDFPVADINRLLTKG